MIVALPIIRADQGIHTQGTASQGQKGGGMVLKSRTRLQKLCRCALQETDPHKLAVLLTQIEDVIGETLNDLADMLRDVEGMIKKIDQSTRIHLS
jgi:hypothetical protein